MVLFGVLVGFCCCALFMPEVVGRLDPSVSWLICSIHQTRRIAHAEGVGVKGINPQSWPPKVNAPLPFLSLTFSTVGIS